MKQTSDHDTIIRIDQKVGDLQIAVKEIKDSTIARIESLEKTKADRIETDALQKKLDDNIEVRVRSLETDRVTQRDHCNLLDQVADISNKQSRIMGYAAAIGFVVSIVASYLLRMLTK